MISVVVASSFVDSLLIQDVEMNGLKFFGLEEHVCALDLEMRLMTTFLHNAGTWPVIRQVFYRCIRAGWREGQRFRMV